MQVVVVLGKTAWIILTESTFSVGMWEDKKVGNYIHVDTDFILNDNLGQF
jgi:hypothetical protein